MTVNPRDYDLRELRKMARQRGEADGMGEWAFDPDTLEVGLEDEDGAGGTSYRAGLYRELLPFLGGDGFEKPYLQALPATYAAEYVVFEWLEFLLTHAGYQGAMDALDYYESIHWITGEVEADLSTYLRGIENEAGSEVTELDVEDHMLSLVYLAKLRVMH